MLTSIEDMGSADEAADAGEDSASDLGASGAAGGGAGPLAPGSDGALPAIVYGQTLAALAKGGAEAQTFQVLCEMLEAGVKPMQLTVDFITLELSKRGAVKVRA